LRDSLQGWLAGGSLVEESIQKFNDLGRIECVRYHMRTFSQTGKTGPLMK
jgi:hypothetical protein